MNITELTPTSFDLVSDMNTAFGNPQGNPVAIDMEKLKSQCKNILDEYNELMAAIEAGDMYGIRDALCDIHVFAYGAHHLMGLDADKDMDTVVSAVMTRFVKDTADLEATLEKLEVKGITHYYFEGSFPKLIVKSGSDQPDAPKGKFIKSASYKEPEFEDVCFAANPPEGWSKAPVGNWGLTPSQQIPDPQSNDGA